MERIWNMKAAIDEQEGGRNLEACVPNCRRRDANINVRINVMPPAPGCGGKHWPAERPGNATDLIAHSPGDAGGW